MNQCQCGSYAVNDDPDGVLCDRCLRDIEIEKLRMENLQLAKRIRGLCDSLPSGIDLDADPDDQSPADMTAHIGGLIAQACERALEGKI